MGDDGDRLFAPADEDDEDPGELYVADSDSESSAPPLWDDYDDPPPCTPGPAVVDVYPVTPPHYEPADFFSFMPLGASDDAFLSGDVSPLSPPVAEHAVSLETQEWVIEAAVDQWLKWLKAPSQKYRMKRGPSQWLRRTGATHVLRKDFARRFRAAVETLRGRVAGLIASPVQVLFAKLEDPEPDPPVPSKRRATRRLASRRKASASAVHTSDAVAMAKSVFEAVTESSRHDLVMPTGPVKTCCLVCVRQPLEPEELKALRRDATSVDTLTADACGQKTKDKSGVCARCSANVTKVAHWCLAVLCTAWALECSPHDVQEAVERVEEGAWEFLCVRNYVCKESQPRCVAEWGRQLVDGLVRRHLPQAISMCSTRPTFWAQ
jgi:hypothetical protein